jgi:hypothetical protein
VKVWNKQQIKQGQDAAVRIAALNPGKNTSKELVNFKSLLTLAATGQ